MSRSKRSKSGSSEAGDARRDTNRAGGASGSDGASGADAAVENGAGLVAKTTLAVIWEQVGTLVLAVAIALGIRGFVVEPFRIPSGSMLPTLLIGDHLFVNKFIYGPRIPFTDVRLPGIRDPKRGDVVVFEVAERHPARPPRFGPADRFPDSPRQDFVKRLVGLPGDRISVHDGRVTVNGQPLEQWGTGETHLDEVGRVLQVRTEDLLGCGHAVLDDSGSRGLDKNSFVVPEGRYFMMGDNRDYSNDSRAWGTVRLEEFKGPAFILYWSWDVNGSALQFFNPVNWFQANKRWDRVFQRVRCEEPTRPSTEEAATPAGAPPRG
jgi:signal peptidase I